VVAGIGALGSELVTRLGTLDCESVFVADPDVLEEKNIARSTLLREATAGQSKVLQALKKLRELFPRTRWSGAQVEIADVEPRQFQNADVLFSCVDTDLARTEIAAIATQYKFPVCDAGLGGTSTRVGRVSWFPNFSSAACFACLLSNKRRAELLSIWESDIHACWVTGRAEQPEWTSTPSMASIIAALQTEITLSNIEKNSQAFSLHLDLDRTPAVQTIQHPRSIDCPFHDEMPEILFPICARAQCDTCGQHFSPNQRIAWVRRRGTCPSCGSHALILHQSLDKNLSVEPAGSAQ